ncbi:MAG: Ig-like domain-containing protein, partial [Thermoguttaceae bacterium]
VASNATMTLTGSGAVYELTIGGLVGSGNVVVKVLAGAAQDAAGNASVASSAFSLVYTQTPGVTIGRAATQADPINQGPIYFTVEFNQAVTGFSSSTLSCTSSGPGTLTASITAGPTTVVRSGATYFDYTVAVAGMTGTGLVVVTMPANSVHNSAGTGNTASTGPTNNVFFDNVPPVITLINPAAGSSVTDAALNSLGYIDVSYSAGGVGVNTGTIMDAKNVFNLYRNNQLLPGVVVNAPPTQVGANTFRYTYTGEITPGTVNVVFVANSFQDDAGNWNTAATYSFTVLPGPPSATPDSYTATQGSTLTVAAPGVLGNDTDPQGYPLTAILVTSPTHGALSLNSNGSFTYTPNRGYLGTDSFIYMASDGSMTSSPTLDSISVGPATMTWTGTSTGNWTGAHWSGASLPYPDNTANAIIQTSYVVQVTSGQAAYSLGISNGGQVSVGPGAALSVTTGTSVTGNGTLNVDPNGAFSTGGTLTLNSGGSLIGGPISAAAYQLDAGTANAKLSGPGGLTKDTGGTVILSGSNSYTGGTVVKDGTLVADNANALPNGTSLTIGAGGTFVFDPSQSASGGLAAGFAAPPADIAAASETSTTIIAAGAVAHVPVTASAISTFSPAISAKPGIPSVTPVGKASSATTAAGNSVQKVLAVARPAAMSSIPVDAVFTLDRSAFDRTASAGSILQAASAWAWLAANESSANSSDQQQKIGWVAEAVDKVLAEFGL